ncbi:hypothetical protein COCNU_07G002820 [Cocos nucifera]|uniref:Uncharacterized protein n=1 Tax=Cocos nucifera TaxID=13894 RepID=A0A8K0N400_COCNU|nr:hypothetical protein COCNU_07G002820 [Cocos nucifera]
MAGVLPKSFLIPNPSLPSTLNSSLLTTRRRKPLPLAPHALADDPKPNQDSSSAAAAPAPAEPPASATSDPTFENRLARVRLKYRSGTGKKAEQRRARKSSGGGGGGKKKVMLPPVPLKEAVAGGLAVEVGFSPYSERLNGRLAGLGLAALLLVELGSGQSLLRYHSPPILFIQLYSIAATAALFIKFEKERISVWPSKPPPSPSSTATAAD